MNLTVNLDDDGITVTISDIHPIAYGDACQHAGDLLLRLQRALASADTDGT